MSCSDGSVSYQVLINGQTFSVSQSSISGAQIRALGGFNDQNMVVKEGAGAEPDQLISEDQQVRLEPGLLVRFYTRPPTVFG